MVDDGLLSPEFVPAGILRKKLLSRKRVFWNYWKTLNLEKSRSLLLQELREEIAPILQIIFCAFSPDKETPSWLVWSSCDTCFQKGDTSLAANYRPISLTCTLCKVLEHIMASHLVEHVNSYDLLYDLEHGFRAKRTCEPQLTMLIEELARNASVGKQTDLVKLDCFGFW